MSEGDQVCRIDRFAGRESVVAQQGIFQLGDPGVVEGTALHPGGVVGGEGHIGGGQDGGSGDVNSPRRGPGRGELPKGQSHKTSDGKDKH